MVAVLIDDGADVGREDAAAHAVEHDLGDRGLAGLGLAARFEVDRFAEAAHLPRRILGVDQRRVIGLGA